MRTYEELKGTEKEVCDLCRVNQKACDSNTELCIAFWEIKSELGEEMPFFEMYRIIRKYPPESLTKYRRNLVADGLIKPSKESIEHSMEMEAKNHKSNSLWEMTDRLKVESDRLKKDRLFFA